LDKSKIANRTANRHWSLRWLLWRINLNQLLMLARR